MRTIRYARLVERAKIAMAGVSLVCLGIFLVDDTAISKLNGSAVMADCFEGFGAVIGVLVMAYLAFERPLCVPFLGRRFWPHYLLSLLLITAGEIAANLAQSIGQLYALRLAIGAVEGCAVLAAIVLVLHEGE